LYCIDSSVIVNSIVEKEDQHEYSSELLDKIIAENTLVVFPNIAIPEISSAISRGTGSSSKAKELVKQLIGIPNFTFVPIDKELALLSAEFSADYGLRGADSLYVAVAHEFGCKLITLDRNQRDGGKMIVDIFTPKEELESLR
jgi:predicted nucleic acid-binding protein